MVEPRNTRNTRKKTGNAAAVERLAVGRMPFSRAMWLLESVSFQTISSSFISVYSVCSVVLPLPLKLPKTLGIPRFSTPWKPCPFRVGFPGPRFPGCAPASRPWAMMCNPFGVQRSPDHRKFAQRAQICDVSSTNGQPVGPLDSSEPVNRAFSPGSENDRPFGPEETPFFGFLQGFTPWEPCP